MSADIREAGVSDIDRLAAIHAQCFTEAWSRDAIAALLETPGTFALLVDDIGMIIVRAAADEAEILTLGVVLSERKAGLGTALVRAAAERASRAGARTMFLEVDARNEVARALYDGLGFRRVGERKAYYGRHSDALVLKAPLPLTFRLGNSPETE